ncbi:aminobutyraldehyde dehydrogenase [Arthrobacter mangrovi]|uniref:Gamma-aminobutyraldehyde dehydrogenase n=1 Tax=Arthrobacter mangrovi TaxID=2966350 RepID=A0ABQ5MYU2_9MICC|nr:aminobutyraldehyde dehydrogenase [Arthrobacter mangrovi]GLB69119.1 gamma-aminobutyraldehyde dehydrogenase [Arthrobacter mangrovi]
MTTTTFAAAHIAGEARAGSAERVHAAVDPSTGQTIAEVPIADASMVHAAVVSAQSAFDNWADTTPVERDTMLNALADRLIDHQQELGDLEARNTGKPRGVAFDEVAGAAEQLRFFGGAARVLEGKAAREYVAGRTSFIRRDPVGVIGQITPWNYPLVMAAWKIGPALAAGNTIVLKPSELTPLSTLRLAELTADILPPGVLNVVAGDGSTGAALSGHPGIDMVCVTGSVGTGQHVLRAAAERVKRTHLELGGKAPVMVFPDADFARLAETLKVASFWNSGQDCTAACRLLVQDNAYDDLMAALVPAVASLRVGGPFEADAMDMGPVISAAQRDRVTGFIDRASSAGADIVIGGSATGPAGYFVEPTIIGNVGADAEIVRSEVFGPVITVQRFSDEQEALSMANGVDYGLSASVWTENLGRSLRLARKLQFGAVWLNDHLTVADEMPHGGYKMSGYGKDLSTYAIEDYTVVKHVMARID